MTITLYIALIFAWGGSWIAISFQQSDVAPLVSIFYRFALAAIILYPLAKLSGKIEKVAKKDHFFFLLQASFLFSFNFICFYHASHYIVSGLIAVIFSLAMPLNMLNGYLIYRTKPQWVEIFGALIGVGGIIFVFFEEITLAQNLDDLILGSVLSFVGVYSFSLGNMVSLRNSRHKINQFTANVYGMIYSSIILLILCLIRGEAFTLSYEMSYLSALLFLSIAATIFGFVAYLKLVSDIGAAKAAYILIITPIVALVFSALFENYEFKLTAIFGLLLIATGSIITNLKNKKAS